MFKYEVGNRVSFSEYQYFTPDGKEFKKFIIHGKNTGEIIGRHVVITQSIRTRFYIVKLDDNKMSNEGKVYEEDIEGRIG